MMNMASRRSPSPTARPGSANNTANNGRVEIVAHQREQTKSTAVGNETVVATNERRQSRKSVKIKTPTIDAGPGLVGDGHIRQKSPSLLAARRASHQFGRWSPPTTFPDDDTRTLARNMATSRSVRVKSTYSKSPDQHNTSSKRSLRPVLMLTNGQKQAVQVSWRHLKEHYGERAAEQILQKLVNDQPKIKDAFYQAAFLTVFTRSNNTITTFRDHARLLYRTLDDFVENLDNRSGFDRVLKELRESGAKHAFLRKSGFKPDTWERFGEAAVDVINSFECVKSNPEAGKAWTILIASITDELRSGFESEARKLSYSSDRPKSACD